MMILGRRVVVTAGALLAGCAGLQFTGADTGSSFVYNAPMPFAVVKTAVDCTKTVEVLMLPGRPQGVRFHSGLGSAKLGIKLTNGMITDVSQETDTKIPETITALTNAAKVATEMAMTSVGNSAKPPAGTCPSIALFQVVTTGDTVSFRRATDLDAALAAR